MFVLPTERREDDYLYLSIVLIASLPAKKKYARVCLSIYLFPFFSLFLPLSNTQTFRFIFLVIATTCVSLLNEKFSCAQMIPNGRERGLGGGGELKIEVIKIELLSIISILYNA